MRTRVAPERQSPIKHKIQLQLKRVGDKNSDVVLSQTSASRREAAAIRVQTRMRCVLAKRRARQLMAHRQQLNRKVLPLQNRARIVLARNKVAELRRIKLARNAIRIQKIFRGHIGRKKVKTLQNERAKEEYKARCIVKIQGGITDYLLPSCFQKNAHFYILMNSFSTNFC